MPDLCVGCSLALPHKAAFCPRCGQAVGTSVVVRETAESLLRQLSSMLCQHSRRKLVVKFITPWGFDHRNPKKKIASVRFHTGLGILDSSRTFVITPLGGKTLFMNGSWADIAVEVFHEVGLSEARAFAEAYRVHAAVASKSSRSTCDT